MRTLDEIREAIRKLPAKDAWQLAQELREYLDDLWDKQFEEDVKAGRLDNVIGRARKSTPAAKAGPESCDCSHAALGSSDEHAG
jgi:hypothetical protein